MFHFHGHSKLDILFLLLQLFRLCYAWPFNFLIFKINYLFSQADVVLRKANDQNLFFCFIQLFSWRWGDTSELLIFFNCLPLDLIFCHYVRAFVPWNNFSISSLVLNNIYASIEYHFCNHLFTLSQKLATVPHEKSPVFSQFFWNCKVNFWH